MNVLIIEDDKNLAKSLWATFQKYETTNRISTLHSYDEYLKLPWNVISYDVVLLDIHLGEWYKKAGLEILQHIRRKNHTLPVIMITSHCEYVFLEQAFAYGANDYMIKPFRHRELQIRIQRCFCNYMFSEYFAITKYIEYHELQYDISANSFYIWKTLISNLSRSSKYILCLFLIHKEKLLSHSFLEEKIWWYSENIRPKNIRIKIMRLKNSLSQYHIDSWILNYRGEGFMLKKPFVKQ